MKKVLAVLMVGISALATADAFAASGVQENGGTGILVWSFIAFAALLFISQAIPAIAAFFSMIRGLFSTNPTETRFSPWKGRNR